MSIDFNVNKGLENPKSGKFIKRIIIIIILIAVIVIAKLIMSNTHNKFFNIETNIPENKPSQILVDTAATKKSDSVSIKQQINQYHTGSGDNVGGDKKVNSK